VSPDDIWVIDKAGALKLIYTPFTTICLVALPDIKEGNLVSADAINLTIEIKKDFVILREIAYYIIFFNIILE
jgi:hypothetical protein